MPKENRQEKEGPPHYPIHWAVRGSTDKSDPSRQIRRSEKPNCHSMHQRNIHSKHSHRFRSSHKCDDLANDERAQNS